jgi:hypothetical protein
MKYRATLPGFIDRRIKVGDLVEWDGQGNPPIDGLVLVQEKVEAPATAEPEVKVLRNSRRPRNPAPPAEPAGDPDDVI